MVEELTDHYCWVAVLRLASRSEQGENGEIGRIIQQIRGLSTELVGWSDGQVVGWSEGRMVAWSDGRSV